MIRERFTGPVFIIGMPRSGTKLLRELLNQHPQIRIASIETEFLPYWIKNWSSFGDLSDRWSFGRFYQTAIQAPYFTYMRERAKVIEQETWYCLCKQFTPAGVFEALIRHDVDADYHSDFVWGDKSPSYITHMPLLKEQFPQARFIHIVRDVRDYCLSLKKAFGKHMLRSAQRWADDVAQAKRDAQELADSYAELHYEDLLETPAKELQKCCEFLDLDFDPRITRLDHVVENLGDAKEQKAIKQDNKAKYLRLMKPDIRREIEAISADTLRLCGYPVEYEGTPRRLSNWQMRLYQIHDGINLVRLDVEDRGLLGAFRFYTRYFATSGNRGANKASDTR